MQRANVKVELRGGAGGRKERKCRSERKRDMEGHSLRGSVYLFAEQLDRLHAIFYIIPPVVIKHIQGQHVGLVSKYSDSTMCLP